MTRRNEPTDARAPAALTSGRVLARNAAWNLATQCVPMAAALLSMPWVIRGLGTERFGVLTLAWMVLGYFSLFDLGLGRALTKMVAEVLGKGEPEAVPGLVGTALTLMTALGAAGAAFVAALTPWLVGRFLHIEGPLRAESEGSFYLMAAALPFLIGTSGLRGVMEAHQRFGAINAVRTVASLAIQLGPLAVIPWTRDLRAAVGVMALARVASWAAHVVICLREVPALRHGLPFRRALVGPLLGFGGWMTAVNVINPLMVQMDRFLIGARVTASAVAYYTTPYELIVKAWFLSNSVLGVMFPAFAASYATDRKRTAELLGRCLAFVGMILFPVALVAVGLGEEVLTLWVGPEFARQGTRVLQWLAVGVLVCGVAQVPSALIQGVGRPDLTFKIHLAELPPYLALAWWLIGRWGIEGAAVAWTARTLLDLALYTLAARAVLPEGAEALRQMNRGLLAAVAALGVTALPLGLPYRAAAVAAVAAAFAAVSWTRLLGPAGRAAVRSRLSAARDRLAPGVRARVSVEVAGVTDR